MIANGLLSAISSSLAKINDILLISEILVHTSASWRWEDLGISIKYAVQEEQKG